MTARAAGLTLALAMLLATAASTDRGAVRARPAGASADSRTLAGSIAASWLLRQHASGSFPDYMAARGSPARDLYGDAMLGYGLRRRASSEATGAPWTPG